MSVTKSSLVGKGRTTAGGVPASDRRGSSNVWEWWQVLEGFEALGQQAVLSVRALNRGKQLSTIVINGSQKTCGDNNEWRGEESEAEMDFMSVAVEERRRDLLGILVPPHTSAFIVFGSQPARGKRRVDRRW